MWFTADAWAGLADGSITMTYPGIVSTALARRAGKERAPFKTDVRTLKELGLTGSLEVGYRLSPRGEAVLRLLG